MLNRGVSVNNNLDNSTSGNNEVRGGDPVSPTNGKVSGTGSVDGATVETTSERGESLPIYLPLEPLMQLERLKMPLW